MKKINTKKLLLTLTNLEKKHKVISYASLVFLSVSAFFLRKENQKINIKYAILKQKNINLRQNMILYNRNYEDFPFPFWQKVKRDSIYIVQYLNPEYVKTFGHHFNNDQYHVIGKNNFQLLPKKIAKKYFKQDSLIAVTGKRFEYFQKYVNKEGDSVNIKVVKWRSIRDKKDTLINSMVKEIPGVELKLLN